VVPGDIIFSERFLGFFSRQAKIERDYTHIILVDNNSINNDGLYLLHGFRGILGGKRIRLYTPQQLDPVAFTLIDTNDNVMLNPGRGKYEFIDI
jgi:hypothetical protein